MHPLERLINLVALLLESRRPLTFEEIRDLISGYSQDDDAAAKRMFERDKDALREVGIPVELAATDAWDVERGYTIPRERYGLQDLSFTPEEMWALFVAAHTPGRDGEAEHAFWKLSATADQNALAALAERTPAPGIDVSGAHLGVLADALGRRRAVAFRYRPLRGKPSERRVEPYALAFRRGSWYVLGLDRGREAIRAFRLSRILSTVRQVGPAGAAPEGFDASRQLAAGPWGLGAPEGTARIAFSPRIAWLATGATPGASVGRVRRDGWVETVVPAGDDETLVSWVLSFGPDARVLSPRRLRDRVVERLTAMATGG